MAKFVKLERWAWFGQPTRLPPSLLNPEGAYSDLVAAMHILTIVTVPPFSFRTSSWLYFRPSMSRRTDYNAVTAGDQTLQDEEVISATGEGDEEMEDAAEQEEEGYSA